MAGWRSGFDSTAHKAAVIRALKQQSALCPKCGFDLINQRRPDCPECGLAIDPRTLVVQDAPPGPLLVRTLAAAVGLSWLAMIVGGFAWAGAVQALALTALFALQLAAGWTLLTLCTDTAWYRGVSTPRRKLLRAGSIAAAAIAGTTAILAIAGILS